MRIITQFNVEMSFLFIVVLFFVYLSDVVMYVVEHEGLFGGEHNGLSLLGGDVIQVGGL